VFGGGETLYWTNFYSGRSVWRYSLLSNTAEKIDQQDYVMGSGAVVLPSSLPFYLAITPTGDLFWTDAGQGAFGGVRTWAPTSPLGGKAPFITNADKFLGSAGLAVTDSTIYWTTYTIGCQVHMLDRATFTTRKSYPLNMTCQQGSPHGPSGIIADGDFVYWGDVTLHRVYRMKPDGSNLEVFAEGPDMAQPFQLISDVDYIYFTDRGTFDKTTHASFGDGKIFAKAKNAPVGDPPQVLARNLTGPLGIAVGPFSIYFDTNSACGPPCWNGEYDSQSFKDGINFFGKGRVYKIPKP
jgi:hypothetical protein